MTTTSRRAVLAGAIGTTAAAALPAGALAASNSDAELLRLIDEYHRIEQEDIRATERADLAKFAAKKKYPPEPEWPEVVPHREWPEGPTTDEQWLSILHDHRAEVRSRKDRKLIAKMEEAQAEYEAACRAIDARHNVPVLRAAAEAVQEEEHRIFRRIIEMPATTLRGVITKLRFIDDWLPFIDEADDETWVESLLASILDDAERMAGSMS